MKASLLRIAINAVAVLVVIPIVLILIFGQDATFLGVKLPWTWR